MSVLGLTPCTVAVSPPLPLPPASWGAPEALAALAQARPWLPVLLPEPVVASALTTVVLRAGDYAVKVYPPGTDPAHLERLADALAGSATAHLPLGPPVTTAHGVVTLAPWLPAARPVPWGELGTLLRRFHADHAAADVPAWTPPGPRLIDLDWVARAPREYDLASAARRFRVGDISRRTYARFCRGYGFDVRAWPGLPVLDRIADLGGVAFRIWDSRHHGVGLDWLARELPAWRTPL
jgi:hypothetical protein